MTIKNLFKKKPFKEVVKTWSSEEKMNNLKDLLLDIEGGAAFIYDGNDLITGYYMVFSDGENYFTSDPVMFPWPIQHLPMPKALKREIN